MAEYIEREATVKLLRSLGSRDYRREKGTIQEAIKMVSFSEYTPAADVARCGMGVGSKRKNTLLVLCTIVLCVKIAFLTTGTLGTTAPTAELI